MNTDALNMHAIEIIEVEKRMRKKPIKNHTGLDNLWPMGIYHSFSVVVPSYDEIGIRELIRVERGFFET